MKALRFSARRSLRRCDGGISAPPRRRRRVGPLSLIDDDAPELPTPDWVRAYPRLAGICGSDLSTVDGQRRATSNISSASVRSRPRGRRRHRRRPPVVLDPVLGHAARGFEPPFDGAQPGDGDDYRHLTTGDLEPGIQTGFCETTGGAGRPSSSPTPASFTRFPTG